MRVDLYNAQRETQERMDWCKELLDETLELGMKKYIHVYARKQLRR